MTHVAQIKIAATYMRGGTSKGVFFRLQDLPASAQVPGAARDAWLQSQGFQVLHFWNHDILQNTDLVLQAIWAAVDAAAPSPPTPLPQAQRGAKT